MAMARDYYDILGVPRDASDGDIKRAFRTRARELHPDVNPDPQAEARFKELAQAYEALSDPETRAVYDRYGAEGLRGRSGPEFADFGSFQDLFDAFFGGDVFGRRAGPRGGDDIGVAVEISFAESAHGVTQTVEYDAVGACDACEGSGAAPGAEIVRCAMCGGQGQVRQVSRGPFGQFVRAQACPQCRGAGDTPSEACPACAGRGRVVTVQTLSVDIPAGIANGQRIRIPGRGGAGERGAPTGDLYVEVAVADDDRFVREGPDLVSVVDVSATEAMLGAEVEVETLDGAETIEVRPGTQHGERVTLSGLGLPTLRRSARGDQHVLFSVVVPANLTEEQRELAARLGETITEENLRGRRRDGLFSRVRRAFG